MGRRKKTYREIDKQYRRLSCENSRWLRKKETPENFDKARLREERLYNGFLSACRHHLTKDDVREIERMK